MSTLLISCADGRLRDALGELERRLGVENGDRILVPGGPLVLTGPAPERDHVLGWIETVVRGRGAHTIFLVAHQQCLAFQLRNGGFFYDEREVLERSLLAAKACVSDRIYGVSVDCYLVPWREALTGGVFGLAEAVG